MIQLEKLDQIRQTQIDLFDKATPLTLTLTIQVLDLKIVLPVFMETQLQESVKAATISEQSVMALKALNELLVMQPTDTYW